MSDDLAVDPIETLKASRGLTSDDDFARFEGAIDALAERMNAADLLELHRSFDDGTEDFGLYWNLVHLIEDYDFADGARVFVDVLPEMVPSAREWMETLLIRQLNHDGARSLLVAAGRAAPAAHLASLRDLLVPLATDSGTEVVDSLAERARSALAGLAADP